MIGNNPNSIFTTNHSFQVRYSSNHLYMGKVVNKQRHHDLTQSYDVRLFDWDVVLPQCKKSAEYAGYNGTGHYEGLQEGDPVLLLCRNGFLEDAVIIKSLWTNGDYKKFLGEGTGNKPGELVDGAEANQVSIHPNRVTQPEASFDVVPTKMLASSYDSPEFHVDTQSKADARPQAGSIFMRNGMESVAYTYGSQINYAQGNHITVSSGTKEDKCSQLLRLASTHSRIANYLTTNTLPAPSAGLAPLTPPSTANNTISDFNEPLPSSYRANMNAELARMALGEAQQCNVGAASLDKQSSTLNSTYGAQVTPSLDKYKPPQKSAHVSTTNRGVRAPLLTSSTDKYRARYKALNGKDPGPSKPSYDQWKQLFKEEAAAIAPQGKPPIVLLGDSITQSFPLDLLPTTYSWLNQGISGDRTTGVLSRLPQVIAANPVRVLLMVGINDLLAQVDPETVAANILKIAGALHAATPAVITVQTVLPRAQVPAATNPAYKAKVLAVDLLSIIKVNALVVNGLPSTIKFLDVYTALSDGEGYMKPANTTDGIHLTREGYKPWADLIVSTNPPVSTTNPYS